MRVHRHVGVTSARTDAFMWTWKVNAGYLPQYFSTLFLEAESLSEAEAHQLIQQGWMSRRPQGFLLLPSFQ